MIAFVRTELSIFLLAVQFLTRIPLPKEIGFTPERLAAAPRYYPLVGILIGGLLALVYGAASALWTPLLGILLSTAAGLLLTGAFHEDGLADCFDGIGGGSTRERALEIMKDSRIGTYGTVALGLCLAIKIATLVTLPAVFIGAVLILGHCLSRLSAVIALATSTYVRDHGTGKPTSDGIHILGLIFSVITGLICCVIGAYWVPTPAILVGLLGLLVGHLTIRLLYERKLGGYTGDCLGAVQQVSEVGFYLGVLAWV